MSWLDSLYGRKPQPAPKPESRSASRRVLRQGKFVPADEAFGAWTSGDLERMLEAVSVDTNPIDRHHLLQMIVMKCYALRTDELYRDICIEHGELYLQEFPELAPALAEGADGIIFRISVFQQYATVLTELGRYDKAIAVCEIALKWGLRDGTQSGFEGRIARIRKKAAR